MFSSFEEHCLYVGNKIQGLGFPVFLTCFWTHRSGVKVVCMLYKAINEAAVVTAFMEPGREQCQWLGFPVYRAVPLLQFDCLLLLSNA